MLDTDKREYMISKETISKSLNSDRLPIIDGNILLSSYCNLDLSFSYTGKRGGDAGHGGFLEIFIVDKGNFHMEIDKIENGVRLNFAGDAELDAIISALNFMLCNINKG